MDVFSDLIAGVQLDLTVDSNSSLFTPTIIKSALNSAYRKAGGLFNWPELTDAKKTLTEAGYEYYDFPDNWRTDSIWRLEVDGDQYGEDPDGSPLDWNDYLQWKADSQNDNSTEKKWAVNKRQFFIFPVPTASGSFTANTGVISVWGQKIVETLSSDSDTTIFSYSMPECNEAIRLEAVSILKNKAEQEQKGQLRSLQAQQILTNAWNRIKSEKVKYEKNTPMFNVPDFFGNSAERIKNDIGRF